MELASNEVGVISCGLGPDISFDKEMSKLGFRVYGIEVDSAWLEHHKYEIETNGNLFFESGCVGSGGDGTLGLNEILSRAESLLGKNKFALKMDIEGSEISVLEEIPSHASKVFLLMFELDYLSLISFLDFRTRVRRYKRTARVVNALCNQGFQLYKVEGWNIHLLRSSL